MLLAAAFLALTQPGVPAPPPAQAAAAAHGRTLALPGEAVVYVPASAGPHPPLLVLLHGAGRGNAWMIDDFWAEADRRGIVLLAPTSKGVTWDAIGVALAPAASDNPLDMKLGRRFSSTRDSRRVDVAIANLARQVAFDPARTVLAGFSDGATFALAMGIARSEKFAAVIAWSPGIAIETASPARGRTVFVSHGRQDPTLRFEVTCGEIVPQLQSEGAKVRFVAFDGIHEVPETVKLAFLDEAFGAAAGARPQSLPAEAPDCPCNGGMQQLFVVGEPTGYRRNKATAESMPGRCGGGD